jgi:hypothetical protein
MGRQTLKQLAWDRELISAFMPAVAVSQWDMGALDIFHGSQAYEIMDGEIRLLMAAKGFERGGVRYMEITGLVSDGARMTTETAGYAIDTLSNIYGANKVGVFTPHKHLHRIAERIGFTETGRQFFKSTENATTQ